jgi:hypothetical protein
LSRPATDLGFSLRWDNDNHLKLPDFGQAFFSEEVLCREGYTDAGGVLAHLDNVGALLTEALKIADLTRVELHGPEKELDKLKGPLAHLNPKREKQEPPPPANLPDR